MLMIYKKNMYFDIIQDSEDIDVIQESEELLPGSDSRDDDLPRITRKDEMMERIC